MSATVNVNGNISDQRQAVVSVFDHGFLYGEGVYETLRTYNRRPFLLDRHLRRLRKSAGMIALGVPLTDDQIADRLTETVEHASRTGPRDTEWYIRILLTRGVGELTYDIAATPAPTMVMIVKPHVDPPAEFYATGVRVIISSIVRNHPETVNPMIKSNNLLNCALAMQEAQLQGRAGGGSRLESLHRQGGRRPDAAAQRGIAAGDYPRVHVGGWRSGGHPGGRSHDLRRRCIRR
jgi:branched-chain amino acid aminotransferase